MNCTDDIQSTQQDEEAEENGRIIQLQDLIEKNIQIGRFWENFANIRTNGALFFFLEQKIESRSFGESMSAIFDILGKANDVVKGYEERKTNSTEILLDSELLRRNHEVVGKAIQYNTNFTDRMYCTAIVS